MSRAFVLVPVVLVLALGVVLSGARQRPDFRGGTNTVSIFATALDENQRLVTDLSADDFEVFDNGVKQPLTVFANEQQSITIVVMLDRSGSMQPHFGQLTEAANVFVDNLLPDDRARIGSFSDKIRIDPGTFTTDRDVLRRVLRYDLMPPGTTPLWRATDMAMDALKEEEGRRVILMFTDGKDTPSAMVGQNVSFRDVRSRSQTEEVMVYAIGFSEGCAGNQDSQSQRVPRGGGGPLFQRGHGGGGGGARGPMQGPRMPGMPIPGFPRAPTFPGQPRTPPRSPAPPWAASCSGSGPDPDLRDLAAVGGGGYFELRSTADLRATFKRVADELHHQYLLAFTATKLDHTLHQLDVTVRQPRTTVRARRTYLAD